MKKNKTPGAAQPHPPFLFAVPFKMAERKLIVVRYYLIQVPGTGKWMLDIHFTGFGRTVWPFWYIRNAILLQQITVYATAVIRYFISLNKNRQVIIINKTSADKMLIQGVCDEVNQNPLWNLTCIMETAKRVHGRPVKNRTAHTHVTIKTLTHGKKQVCPFDILRGNSPLVKQYLELLPAAQAAAGVFHQSLGGLESFRAAESGRELFKNALTNMRTLRKELEQVMEAIRQTGQPMLLPCKEAPPETDTRLKLVLRLLNAGDTPKKRK